MNTGKQKSQVEEEYSGKGRTYVGHEDPYLESLAVGRYKFAMKFIKDGDVCLDAASGSGYGTELLSQKASRVIGLEYDEDTLKYSKEHHQNNKIEYRQADLTRPLDLPGNYFDVVVSIETIEHITNHDTMLSEFLRVLKPGGLLVASTVEHEVYSEKGGIKNKHHIGELTKKQLVTLISRYFKLEELYGQVKYVPLPWNQRLTRPLWHSFLIMLGKVDVFKTRYRVAKMLNLNIVVDKVNEGYSPMKTSDFEKSNFEDENVYYQLMFIARKTQG